MITGITNTPRFFIANNSKINNTNRNYNYLSLNQGLTTDTITFTSSKEINKLADVIFTKIAKNRQGNNLGYYLATNDRKVNIHISETKFGKEAIVSLTNGKFKNKDYTIIQINKDSLSSVRVKSLDSNRSNKDSETILLNNLKNLK